MPWRFVPWGFSFPHLLVGLNLFVIPTFQFQKSNLTYILLILIFYIKVNYYYYHHRHINVCYLTLCTFYIFLKYFRFRMTIPQNKYVSDEGEKQWISQARRTVTH